MRSWALLLLLACAGGGGDATSDTGATAGDADTDADADADADSDADTDTTPTEPGFARDVRPILRPRCQECHLSGFTEGNFNFDDGADDLVDVDSSIGMPYVTPFSTADSYLYRKLAGTHTSIGGTGGRMPKGDTPLSTDEMAVIAQWIEDGALP